MGIRGDLPSLLCPSVFENRQVWMPIEAELSESAGMDADYCGNVWIGRYKCLSLHKNHSKWE